LPIPHSSLPQPRWPAVSLPALYLKGVSTGDFTEALTAILGEKASGLSATNVVRLTLALDLRAGGFEVFPLAKLFDLPSNVWYPSILIRENMLEEPVRCLGSQRFLHTKFDDGLGWNLDLLLRLGIKARAYAPG
jgi:hypothetical protein